MVLHDLLKQRRDTRHFTTDPLPEEVLQKALAAAHLAPSVGLSEAVRFYVIKEQAVKNEIHALFKAENNKVKKGLQEEDRLQQYSSIKLQAILEAPVGIIVTTDYSVLNKFTIGVSGTADTLQWSSVCAVQNLWLSLTEQGYSLGWVSILDYNKLKQLLSLPAHEFPLGYFCLGKPATDYAQQPMLQQINWKEKSPHPIVTEIKQTKPIPAGNFTNQSVTDTLKEDPLLQQELMQLINNKTKPVGALGQLEKIALQVGLIQGSTTPAICNAQIVVFAADHGIAKTGLVNPYPQAVTRQMVQNFFAGGAAINVFCKQNDIGLTIVDAGINYVWKDDEIPATRFLNKKIGFGTRNYLEQNAMSIDEVYQAVEAGKEIVKQLSMQGSNCIGFGEMGIGNSSSAALIMSAITGIPVEACIGRGTGVSDKELETKKTILQTVAQLHQINSFGQEPVILLSKIGGYEIAMMTGAYLQAAEEKMVILVDGFIATSALLIARLWNKHITANCIFAHCSNEQGHQKMLDFLSAEPLLSIGLRLGEGTGAALALPLVKAAVNFLNGMASFESASIDNKS
jgi:nicotinate-nucleotide--dimethylbenzimidazole phosphoribosyltransferase